MRVWTNGSTHVAFGPAGLSVGRSGHARRVGASALDHGFTRGALAVAPRAGVLFASGGSSGTLFWAGPAVGLGASPGAVGGPPAGLGAPGAGWAGRNVQPSALAFLDEATVIAGVGRGRGRETVYGLAVRSLDSIRDQRSGPPEWDTFARYLALPEPKRVRWPTPPQPGCVWTKPTGVASGRRLSHDGRWSRMRGVLPPSIRRRARCS